MIFRPLCTTAACMVWLALITSPSLAADKTGPDANDLAALAAKLKAQQALIAKQQKVLDDLQNRLMVLQEQSQRQMENIRAGQVPPSSTSSPPPPQTPAPSPPERVGEKSVAEAATKKPEAQALPENVSLLLQPGRIIFTPSLEYTRASTNRLVFRGVQIIPGLQLGLIDASDVAQDIGTFAADFRVGLFDRLEFEGRLPFLYRGDRITQVSQQVATQNPPFSQTISLTGDGIGDADFWLRYQINSAQGNDEPVYIANVRLKTATGTGPFDVDFDSNGIAQNLATGSGFWGVGAGMSVIIPSDPVVLYGSANYLLNIAEDINKTIGTTPVGRVSPGDTVNIALGFGLALNPRFSFSLGYSHTMVLPTYQELGNTEQRSNTLQSGSLTFGTSYAFSELFTLNTNFEFGMTSDAPDTTVTFRLPIALN